MAAPAFKAWHAFRCLTGWCPPPPACRAQQRSVPGGADRQRCAAWRCRPAAPVLGGECLVPPVLWSGPAPGCAAAHGGAGTAVICREHCGRKPSQAPARRQSGHPPSSFQAAAATGHCSAGALPLQLPGVGGHMRAPGDVAAVICMHACQSIFVFKLDVTFRKRVTFTYLKARPFLMRVRRVKWVRQLRGFVKEK